MDETQGRSSPITDKSSIHIMLLQRRTNRTARQHMVDPPRISSTPILPKKDDPHDPENPSAFSEIFVPALDSYAEVHVTMAYE